MFEILSDFCKTEIVKLRGGDKGNFELFLMSDLGEAHSNKIIKLCSKHGIVKQTTAGYTPQVNAYAERYFRTNGEMARCQLAQFNMEEEFWEDARDHANWLYNRVPPSRSIPGEPWLSPKKRQYPERKVKDLTNLKPFGNVCWTHVTKARRQGKTDIEPRGEQGVLVGYDDDQGPLLARVYFTTTGVYELHDNGNIQY